MQNTLIFVIQLATIWSSLCTPPPIPIYHSKGANQVLNNEGQNVVTVSGHSFLTNVDPRVCARSCDYLRRKCECCNSFSYNPSQSTCYLKNRQNTMDNSTYNSADGWQSYYNWGIETAYPGGKYDGGLPDLARAATPNWPIGNPYDISYVSQGEGKLAIDEGQPLQTTSGADKLTSVGNKRCSEECNAVDQCDGFSYNLRLDQSELQSYSHRSKRVRTSNSTIRKVKLGSKSNVYDLVLSRSGGKS